MEVRTMVTNHHRNRFQRQCAAWQQIIPGAFPLKMVTASPRPLLSVADDRAYCAYSLVMAKLSLLPRWEEELNSKTNNLSHSVYYVGTNI
jgi:hypothetical protein